MEDKYVLLIVALLVFLIFALVGLVFFLGLLLLKDRKKEEASTTSVSDKQSLKQKILKERVPSHPEPDPLFCHNHPDEEAVGVCAICGEGFCDRCARNEDGQTFCPEHIRTYLSTAWSEIGEVRTTPNDTLASQHLYKLKHDLWHNDNIPSYISTSYKINIDGDTIESFVKICVRASEEEQMLKRLEEYKKKFGGKPEPHIQ